MRLFIFLLIIINCFAGFSQEDHRHDILRVMTYNIHHAEGIDGKINLERIADLILKNNIDLVALQEVDAGVERSFGIDIMDSLAKLINMNSYFEKNINYQGGEYGNGILSKFPFEQKINHHYEMLREGEQRGLLQTVININGFYIAFFNTHIDFRGDDTERLMNIKEITEISSEKYNMPIIVCGDFNDIPGSRTHQKMKENFIDVWEIFNEGLGYTYPVEIPEKRIDYIFLKDEWRILKPLSIEVLWSEASDHLPVIAEFEIIDDGDECPCKAGRSKY
jgi:endonuclease/exonuclease/phosphatase family metal-dependent hydrolase